MRIVAARACTNCLGRRIDYQVEVSPTPVEFEGKPAYLQAEWLSPDQLPCVRPSAA